MPLDEVLIEDVMKPLLPWVEAVRLLTPETPGEVSFALRAHLPASDQRGGLRGRLVDPPPLEIRLPESLLRDLRIEHDQRWVQWEPAGIDVVFDRTNMSTRPRSCRSVGADRWR